MKLMLLQLLLLLDGSQLRQPATQPAARRRSFSQPADVEQPTGLPQAAGRGVQPADPHQSHSAGLWLLPRATGKPPPPMHPSLPPTAPARLRLPSVHIHIAEGSGWACLGIGGDCSSEGAICELRRPDSATVCSIFIAVLCARSAAALKRCMWCISKHSA